MKFEVVKNILYPRLVDINGIIEKKSPQPILQHLLIEAREGELQLLGTDTEITLTTTLPAHVLEQGSITVSSDLLTQLIAQLPDKALIQIHLENEQLFVKSGKSQFQLQTLPAQDYPVAQQSDKTGEIQLDGLTLFALLNKVRFSMAENDMRHYLNGLQLALKDKQIEAVATDGHRLSLASSQVSTSENVPAPLILPAKAVNALSKQLSLDVWISELERQKEACADVESLNTLQDQIDQLKELRKQHSFKRGEANLRLVSLNLGERELSLDNGIYRLSTRLIDGKYPDYEKIIPPQEASPVQIDRKMLLEALKRSRVVLNRKDETGVIMEFDGHNLTISARNNENETAEEHLDIINPQGLQTRIGLNVNYLISVADTIEGERLQLHLQNNGGPVLITCEEETAVKYVIMPMRI